MTVSGWTSSRGIGRLLGVAAAVACFAAAVRAEDVAPDLAGKKVAVAVFPRNPAATAHAKTAQSRIEQILADGDIAVLDEAKTRELKDACKSMEDMAAFITPEQIVENARKFEIDGVLAAYVSVDVVHGIADFFSATAHVDLRFIDNKTARVRAMASPAMGVPGAPPSDGLTEGGAAVNAIRRAVESACHLAGFELAEATRPGSVDLVLADPVDGAEGGASFAAAENDPRLHRAVQLERERWRTEEATCTARSAAGGLAAVAGYIRDTDFRRQPQRLYGSRVHLVDVEAMKTLQIFECSPVATMAKGEKNARGVLFLGFAGSWRHLFAATGNHLYFWDVESGRLLSKIPLGEAPTGLAVQSLDTGTVLLLRSASGVRRYGIVRARP